MKPIADRHTEVEAVHREIFAERIAARAAKKTITVRAATVSSNLDDAALLEKARHAGNGDKFCALYDRGDLQGKSHSEADAALAAILMFWTGNDNARVDALFRGSALMREKWNRADYRERTLELAVAANPYTARKKSMNNGTAHQDQIHPSSNGSAQAEGDKAARYRYPRLDEAALVGIAGDFVRLVAPQSEADLAALLMHFLAEVGCAIGRTAHYEVEAVKHYTNLFTLAVGPTAAGRKGTARAHVRRVIPADVLPAANIQSGLSSGEGVIHAVRDEVWQRGKRKTTKSRASDGAKY